MRIYVVTTGDYEANTNGFVTTSYEEALKYILNLPYGSMFDSFTTLEIWENGKMKYEYGGYQHDTLPKSETTYEQLDKYIQEHIKFVNDFKIKI